MYEFLQTFAPHLTRERIDAAVQAGSREEREALFADLELPSR